MIATTSERATRIRRQDSRCDHLNALCKQPRTASVMNVDPDR